LVAHAVPPEKRSVAVGIAGACGSFGQFVMLPWGQALISRFGWLNALLVLALNGRAAVRPQLSFAAGELSEPERDRSVHDLGRGDEVADATLAEIARQRPQGDAGLQRADDAEDEERHRERMGGAKERGKRRNGEDDVPPQASKDSGGPAGVEREHA